MTDEKVVSRAPRNSNNNDAIQPFRLMDLHAEMRDAIYAMAIENQPEAYVTTRKKYPLSTRSSLPRVSMQVRKEFGCVAFACANFVADIRDFNFSAMITFFNRLRDQDVARLPKAKAPTERVITFRLRLCKPVCYPHYYGGHDYRDSHLDSALWRWLNRLEHPTKKGAKISTAYEVIGCVNDLKARHLEIGTLDPPESRIHEFNKITQAIRAFKRGR